MRVHGQRFEWKSVHGSPELDERTVMKYAQERGASRNERAQVCGDSSVKRRVLMNHPAI